MMSVLVVNPLAYLPTHSSTCNALDSRTLGLPEYWPNEIERRQRW